MKQNIMAMVICSVFFGLGAWSNAMDAALAESPRWLGGLRPMGEPRQEVAVAAVGGKVYVAGGIRADGAPVNTMEVYDPGAGRWVTTTSVPVSGANMALVAVNGKLYAMGGIPVTNRVHVFDPETRQWEARADMPTLSGGFGAAAIGNKIYIAGGYNPDGLLNSLYAYDVNLDTWTQLADMPTARYNFAMGAIAGKLYAVGGRNEDDLALAMTEVYDPQTDSWFSRVGMPTGRSDVSYAVYNDELYVFGGEGNRGHPSGVFGVTEIYDPSTNQWRTGPRMITPRHGTGAAVVGNSIYIPGGADRQGSVEISRVNEVLLGRSQSLYLPHVPTGGGIGTDIILTNFSAELPALGTLDFFSQTGEPASLNINGRVQSSITLSIAPYGSATFRAQANASDPIRVVYAVATTDNPINGSVIFRSGPSIAGVSAGAAFRRFLTPVQINESSNTGLALLNPGTSSTEINLALHNEDGSEYAAATVTLEGGRQFSRFVNEFFSGVDLTNFRGTLVGTSAQGVAGVSLVVSGTQITSIPMTGE